MTDKQMLMFIGLPIGLISMFLIWKIIKIYKNMKRKLEPVFEPVKEFMNDVNTDLKEFTSEMNRNSIISNLDYSISTINSTSELLSAQSDDNYIEYGDLMYPSDILDRILRKHDTDIKNNRRVKNKLNVEELFERVDKSKIKFQKNLEIIKEFLSSIERFKEDNDSKYNDIYYETKDKIEKLYPEFLDAVKNYNKVKNHVEELLSQAKKMN